jgi:hypothetical protein
LGKGGRRKEQGITATYAKVTQLSNKTEVHGHKLNTHTLSHPPKFVDLTKNRNINCCGAVKPNRKGMPGHMDCKTLKLKQGDIRARTRGDLIAMIWEDKKEAYTLTNMHNQPAEGSFCNEYVNAVKPSSVKAYSRNNGSVDKAESYSISQWM